MSYAVSAPLQEAIYTRLKADSALAALVGDDIYDAMPKGRAPEIYVALGPEKVRDAGDCTSCGAWHDFVVSVVTTNAGFHAAKEAAGVVSDVLHEAELALSRGRLQGLWFRKAVAARRPGGQRRIDLSFRARVEDDPAP